MRVLVLLIVAFFSMLPGVSRAQQPVTFPARDGVMVHALVYPASPSRGVLLLFHQAGSNKSEYAPIAPELARLGWTAIAVDQRSGGSHFGGHNETAAAHGGSFDAALADLEGALAYARATYQGQPVTAWGSSYSASLVFLLAAAHPGEVSAILAFSPGEFLAHSSVKGAAAKVRVPIFVTSAADPGEIADAKTLIDAAPAALKVQFVPRHGIHGSSTLRTDTDPSGAAENWNAVRQFLARIPVSASQ